MRADLDNRGAPLGVAELMQAVCQVMNCTGTQRAAAAGDFRPLGSDVDVSAGGKKGKVTN